MRRHLKSVQEVSKHIFVALAGLLGDIYTSRWLALPWVVAKPRIELGTQGFSVLCSTD